MTMIAFIRESNMIEGIRRDPTEEEIQATAAFLRAPLTLESVKAVQSVYAPGKPIRDKVGMNVRIGNHIPPVGGPLIPQLLEHTLKKVMHPRSTPWSAHVQFQNLHPFMDGNGRTGRAVWAWHMILQGFDPFGLPFLHRFYYQTLAAQDRRVLVGSDGEEQK